MATAAEPYFASLTIPARVESLRAAAAFLVQAAKSLKVAAASEPTFELAIVEALTNAFKHGGSRGRAKDATILCELELAGQSLVVRILDSGPGFQLPPFSMPGVSKENVAALPEAGYGLPVIQSVFPGVRTVTRDDWFGLELPLEL